MQVLKGQTMSKPNLDPIEVEIHDEEEAHSDSAENSFTFESVTREEHQMIAQFAQASIDITPAKYLPHDTSNFTRDKAAHGTVRGTGKYLGRVLFDESKTVGKDKKSYEQGYTVDVTSIQRVHNSELVQQYNLYKQEVKQHIQASEVKDIDTARLGNMDHDVNERLLFHGVNPKFLDGMLENGLSKRFNQGSKLLGYGALGKGVYLTDSFAKAVTYSKCSRCGQPYCNHVMADGNSYPRVMLGVTTTMGNVQQTDTKKRHIEQPEAGSHTLMGMGKSKRSQSAFDDTEVSIFDDKQMYISHVIQYRLTSPEFQLRCKSGYIAYKHPYTEFMSHYLSALISGDPKELEVFQKQYSLTEAELNQLGRITADQIPPELHQRVVFSHDDEEIRRASIKIILEQEIHNGHFSTEVEYLDLLERDAKNRVNDELKVQKLEILSSLQIISRVGTDEVSWNDAMEAYHSLPEGVRLYITDENISAKTGRLDTDRIENLIDDIYRNIHKSDVSHNSCSKEMVALHKAIVENNRGAVKILIHQHGPILLNQRDELGRNSVHIALAQCNLEMGLLLLRSGAQDNFVDSRGFTPIELLEDKLTRKCQYLPREIEQKIDVYKKEMATYATYPSRFVKESRVSQARYEFFSHQMTKRVEHQPSLQLTPRK